MQGHGGQKGYPWKDCTWFVDGQLLAGPSYGLSLVTAQRNRETDFSFTLLRRALIPQEVPHSRLPQMLMLILFQRSHLQMLMHCGNRCMNSTRGTQKSQQVQQEGLSCLSSLGFLSSPAGLSFPGLTNQITWDMTTAREPSNNEDSQHRHLPPRLRFCFIMLKSLRGHIICRP